MMKIKLFFIPFIFSVFFFLPLTAQAAEHTASSNGIATVVGRDVLEGSSEVYHFDYVEGDFTPFAIYIVSRGTHANTYFPYYFFPSSGSVDISILNHYDGSTSSKTEELTRVNGETWYFFHGSSQTLWVDGSRTNQSLSFTPYGPSYEYDHTQYLTQAINIARQLINSGNVPDWEGEGEVDPDDGNIVIPIPPLPDPDDWIPDYGLIPAPDVMFTNTNDGTNKSWYTFVCNNNQDNYYIELQCLWYTFNDYSLRKKGFSWYVDYDEIQYNMLANDRVAKQHIVNASDFVSAEGIVDIHQAALKGLNNFLDNYPFSSLNNITPSSVQSMSGYTNAYNSLANNYVSKYVEAKIWIRYFTFENGDVRYGAWTPYKFNIPPSGDLEGAEPNEPIPDPQPPIPEPDPDPDIDEPEPDPDNPWPIPIPDGTNLLQNIVDWLNDLIASVTNVSNTILGFFTSSVNQLGQYPTLLARVFQFLPQWFISAISIGMLTAIILRIFGR